MYLRNETIVAEVDGLTFTSFPSIKPHFVLDPTAVSGWYDGVGVRRTTTVRPVSSGDFPEKSRMASRVISFSGTAVSNTASELHQMRDQLMGAINDGGYVEISLQDSSGIKYATVGLEDRPSWLILHDTFAAWKLDLYAPDPRIYGVKEYVTIGDGTVSGGLDYPLDYSIDYNTPSTVAAKTINNLGNTESWPEFKVTGNFNSGFSLTNSINKRVTYNGLVTMQAPVIINMATGTATQNGVDKTILVSRRDWFSIPPKSSIRPSFLPIQDGTGWCDIIYRDTWI